ncbi:putative protein of unknown function DUF541 [Candidatus Nitrososphaera gargensis Ga9.2]|uniref:Uncharacterized protein n=1 Tax=Nitrososphaera gargensis (strain Ga9.2) TaxID=1237085 RepID=K0INR2_NITGG|nr:putative protein of unknown function DUF541 [Candidatus Nitrososphaera gargensis Ga9.2]
MYFFISAERQEEIRDSLIVDAIANARHRAEVTAEAVGMSIYRIQSINLNYVYFPVFSRGIAAAEPVATPILPGEQQVSSMTVNIVFYMSGAAVSSGGSEDDGGGSFGLTEPAMEFLLSKLPELGIQIKDKLNVHMDQVVHISENEYHVEFSVRDVNGQMHDAHIEVVDGM